MIILLFLCENTHCPIAHLKVTLEDDGELWIFKCPSCANQLVED